MTRPAVVWLEATHAWLLRGGAPPVAVTLAPMGDGDDVPDLQPVRDACASDSVPSELVLVIGGAWLQCARPSLPPLEPRDRRRALHHQADRFFPMRGAIASTVYDGVAIACPARWLERVREQLTAWTTLRVVVSLPEAAAATGLSGEWHTGTAPSMLMTLRDGTVADARVTRGAAPAASRAIDPTALLRAVQQAATRGWPRERQLLDVAGDDRLARAAQRAWWRAAALLTMAVGLLGWAMGQHRERVLAAAEAAQQSAAAEAAGALAAQARVRRAERESALLQAANAEAAHAGAPSLVIATLGQLLPPTAFVQHLEWDGRQWKIDGSAVDAAGLVPRLDAVPAFEQVRSLAPSTRFLDNGIARSSFSIGFAVRDATGAAAARAGGGDGQR